MADPNRNAPVLFDESGQAGIPAYPLPNAPGPYSPDMQGYPQYPNNTYNQGVAPAGPVAPYFSAPVSAPAYDVYGNPLPYQPDYGQQQPVYNNYPQQQPYVPYGDPYTPQQGYVPYDPYAPQQPYVPYAPQQMAPQPYNPYDQAYAAPVQAPQWQPEQPEAQQETPSQDFAQKFAEASGKSTDSENLKGFGELAQSLESKLEPQQRKPSNWPPKRTEIPAPAPRTDIQADVFESTTVALDDKPAAKMKDTEIFKIAEELSQAVLVKSYSRSFNDNNLMREGAQRCIEIEGLVSDYYVTEGGNVPYRMFDNVSLGLNAGSCCALVSDIPLATYVLARAIADYADAGNENFVRVSDTPDEGAGRVLYVGSDVMLPNEMTCEDYLLYTMAAHGRTDEEDREKLTILLSQLGMGNLQEVPLPELSYNVRILLLVLAGALNPEIVCVIVNDPKFRVGAEDEMLARRVFALLNNRGKCSLLAACSPFMMSAVANRIAVLTKGQLVFFGEYKNFLDSYCLGIMSFNVENAPAFAAQLEQIHPEVSALCKDRLVYLVRRWGYPEGNLEMLIKDIISLGADYNSIVMDEKSFAGACKEVLGG